jgi:hypothetical protein
MHLILLPFHEAGHVFFLPFGRFMHFLGGSLFQVALPLGLAYAFYARQSNVFGAAVCVWWAGASLLDIAPYIWDAYEPVMALIGGEHDWVYLLGTLGLRRHAHSIASIVHCLGVITMLAGLFRAGSFLYKSKEARRFRTMLKK